MRGSLISLNVSTGGVPKLPILEARITVNGVVGDRQRDTKWHGGAERAVSLLAFAVIRELQASGHFLTPGSTGENLTVAGCTAEQLIPNVRLRIGHGPDAVELLLTKWLEPCAKIGSSFLDRRISVFAHETNPCRSRIGARVLTEGTVRTGDVVEFLS